MDTIKLIPPEGVTSASVDGTQYDIGEDGQFEVDASHALQLYGFGFGNAPAAPPAETAPPADPAAPAAPTKTAGKGSKAA